MTSELLSLLNRSKETGAQRRYVVSPRSSVAGRAGTQAEDSVTPQPSLLTSLHPRVFYYYYLSEPTVFSLETSYAQSCLTLCNPMNYSTTGSSLHEIFQARLLKWLPFLPSEDLVNPGMEPTSPVLQADSLPGSHLGFPAPPSPGA